MEGILGAGGSLAQRAVWEAGAVWIWVQFVGALRFFFGGGAHEGRGRCFGSTFQAVLFMLMQPGLRVQLVEML